MNRVLSLLALSLMLSVALHADVLTACTPGSLATYEGMSLPCGIGHLAFDSFAFPNPPAGGDADTQIWLTPLASGGFQFQQKLDANCDPATRQDCFSAFSSTSPITYTIDYRYIIDPATSTSAELGMDPPSGDVRIDEFYCNDSTGPNSDGFCQTRTGAFRPDHLNVHTNPGQPDPCIDPLNGGNTCFDSIFFKNPGFSFGDVEIQIFLNGSDGSPATFDSISQDTNLTSDVPEPGSFALMLSILLLLPIRRLFSSKRFVGRI